MEKLSSILPSNNRLSVVDLGAAHSVRPGVEGFGVATATHDRRPNLSASDMLTISKPAKEMAEKAGVPDFDKGSQKTIAKQTEAQYFANRKADIANRDQIRAEAHEMAHTFEPEDRLHIADELTNVPIAKTNQGASNSVTAHGAPMSMAAAQSMMSERMFPSAVDRLQARGGSFGSMAGSTSRESGSRLSITA